MDELNNSSMEMSVKMCQSLVSSCASLSSASTALNFGVIIIRVLIHALIKHYILYTARTAPNFPIGGVGGGDSLRGWQSRRGSSLRHFIYMNTYYIFYQSKYYTHITNSNNHNNTHENCLWLYIFVSHIFAMMFVNAKTVYLPTHLLYITIPKTSSHQII